MLFSCLEGPCTAWRLLHDPQAMQGLNAEAVLELARKVGLYGEAGAQKMANATANARMDRDLPP